MHDLPQQVTQRAYATSDVPGYSTAATTGAVGQYGVASGQQVGARAQVRWQRVYARSGTTLHCFAVCRA